MTDTERAPIRSFEIVWASGHVEVIQAHQVTMPQPNLGGMFGTSVKTQDFIRFHGEIGGHWQLILAVKADLIHVIRDKATEEAL